MKKILLNLIFSILIFLPKIALADCFDIMAEEGQRILKLIEADYVKIDGEGARVSDAKAPLLLRGTNGKAVLVQHGFMASPFEVELVGRKLNEEGYTVLMPLLAGFGSTAKVANKYNRALWREYFAINVSLLEKCYSEISLVGFSTGATLTYDYLAKHPTDEKIKSAVLLSSYFAMHTDMRKPLSMLSKMSSGIGVEKYRLSFFSEDLIAPAKNPDKYNKEIPFKAALEVTKLGEELFNENLLAGISKPVLIIFSEYDSTISQTAVTNIAVRNIQYPVMEVLPYDWHIPHQIVVSNVSDKAELVAKRVSRYINYKY